MRSTKSLVKAVAAALALFVITIAGAPPSFAAPSVQISAFDGLSDGQKITVSGKGFQANLSQIAVGLCKEGYTGPKDCYLPGATFRTADGSGSIGSFQITVTQKFGGTDCKVDKCVIGIGPLPTAQDAATIKANSFNQPVTFGAAEAPAKEVADDDTTTDEAAAELPKTGAGDLLPILVIGAGLLLIVGGGLRFGLRNAGGPA